MLDKSVAALVAKHPRQKTWLTAAALGWKATLRERQGKPAEAIKLLRQRIRLPPNGHSGRLVDYLCLGALYGKTRQEKEAYRAFRQGIRYGLHHPDPALLTLLDGLHQLKRLKPTRENIRALQLGSKARTGRPWKPRSGEDITQAVERYRTLVHQQGIEHRRALGLA